MSTMLDLFHARFEAVKAFVSTRGGFDHHLADHAEDHGIAGLTVYVEEDVAKSPTAAAPPCKTLASEPL